MGYTRNYYNWLYWSRFYRGNTQEYSSSTYNDEPNVVGVIYSSDFNIDSSPWYITYQTGSSMGAYARYNKSQATYLNSLVGSGNTEESIEDTALASKFATSVVSSSISTSYSHSDDKTIKLVYTVTGQNLSTSEQIIKEVGIYKYFYGNSEPSGGSSTTRNRTLFFRKVLDTPLVLAPGASYDIKLELIETLGS